MQAVPWMKGTMTPGSHAVFVLAAEAAEAGFNQRVAEHGGGFTLRKTVAEVKASKRTLAEYTWDHTTLHAKKVDKGLTYIQSGFVPASTWRRPRRRAGNWATRCWCNWSSSAPRRAR